MTANNVGIGKEKPNATPPARNMAMEK